MQNRVNSHSSIDMQNRDGDWGLHIEGASTMFCTALCYVTLRLLGEAMDSGDGAMEEAREWILDRGGVTFIPSWGKMWLSVKYLGYTIGVATIHFLQKSGFCLTFFPYTQEDIYNPHAKIQDLLWDSIHNVVEPLINQWPFSKLREKALDNVMQHIHYEDENSRYLCIGPVSKVEHGLFWLEDPNSEAYKFHLARITDYLWVAEDGMKMQVSMAGIQWFSIVGCHFCCSAILATNLVDEYGPMLRKAHDFMKNTQVRTDSSGDLSYWYRHISKGGWPFSIPDNSWIVSDCTSEGLKAALLLARMPSDIVGEAIVADRLYDAVNVILSLQNSNGGFASYELTRSYAWLEMINPVEVFGDIVIDYQYVECTSAAIQGLKSFMKLYPGHRRKEIEACIVKAANFIESIQLPDGSWYGSWGVCYTYGTWFGIKGLVNSGKTYRTSFSIRRACDFLLSKQLDSGGWGESYLSCHDKLLLKRPGRERSDPLHRAAKVLINSQMESGDFPQQEIMGVFNKSCMISYSAYRNIFPIWALGEYRNRVLLTSGKP
ncbi:putative oxidosqualene cyclase [Morella rubra]|uniref:Putative oxidosqualene cyclase n=1 Tax=Morella rubra TaxID=262757 RepID=A0A6A1VGS5_9ROSI|nr:putative oxidosqualene cyclase [Morella rubra]